MKKRNLFWGIIFLLGAIFIIVGKLGYLSEISFFSLFFTVFLLGILIDSLIRLSFPGIFFSAAFLAIIYDKQLGIVQLTPWTILGAALLASIGCSMLFNGKKFKRNWNKKHGSHNFSSVINDKDQQVVKHSTSFSSCIKYVNTEDFRRADLKCSYGAMKVYFDNAVIKEPGARINIDVSFGAMELYIPHSWNLHYSIDSSLSGIEEEERGTIPGTIDVSLTGKASFSGVTIRYI
ncbi:MAG: hypothetical protein HFI75_08405 [Lachnospiraceae bacterium]|nr:hypothetical protein [Lachnospiraceae bacterium]